MARGVSLAAEHRCCESSAPLKQAIVSKAHEAYEKIGVDERRENRVEAVRRFVFLIIREYQGSL